MSAPQQIRVPSQPGTDYAEMVVSEVAGQLSISRCKRSNRGYVNHHASVVLSKHQQIALRDWLCARWGASS